MGTLVRFVTAPLSQGPRYSIVVCNSLPRTLDLTHLRARQKTVSKSATATEGRDIDKERFPGITDYRLKQERQNLPALVTQGAAGPDVLVQAEAFFSTGNRVPSRPFRNRSKIWLRSVRQKVQPNTRTPLDTKTAYTT
jgi:hypothetical protein